MHLIVVLDAGVNTGSMLFRNSAWTRQLLAEMCAHAHREDLAAMRAVRFCQEGPQRSCFHLKCEGASSTRHIFLLSQARPVGLTAES